MIPNFSEAPAFSVVRKAVDEAQWYRESLLGQVDACKSTDDRSYLFATVQSYPKFAIALDELVAAGVLQVRRRWRCLRDPKGFRYGDRWLSDPALYRVPAKPYQPRPEFK